MGGVETDALKRDRHEPAVVSILLGDVSVVPLQLFNSEAGKQLHFDDSDNLTVRLHHQVGAIRCLPAPRLRDLPTDLERANSVDAEEKRVIGWSAFIRVASRSLHAFLLLIESRKRRSGRLLTRCPSQLRIDVKHADPGLRLREEHRSVLGKPTGGLEPQVQLDIVTPAD